MKFINLLLTCYKIVLILSLLYSGETISSIIPTINLPPHNTLNNLTQLYKQFNPYIEASGGMGFIKETKPYSKHTGFIRLGLGAHKQILSHTYLGPELGIQTGGRYRLNTYKTNIVDNYNYVGLPVYYTIYPPIDVLLSIKQELFYSFYVQAKLGGIHLNTMIDHVDIETHSGWQPEFQVGLGVDLTQQSRLSIGYQQFIGKPLKLKTINMENGTASLNQHPTWKALLLSINLSL